ncbi:hypothetical protein BDZ45DRAFT_692010 [Acephala macrosclerotiorum]|nr:hypothetical protein BDZ45DRAFT_692010 [Acephala macrosclerotiorum]
MTAPRCAVCEKPATLDCHHCKAADYCSTRCRDKDAPLHNLLCDTFKSFEISRPRPKANDTSMYKLGLMFSKSSKLPKVLWVRIRRVYDLESELLKPTRGSLPSSERPAKNEDENLTKSLQGSAGELSMPGVSKNNSQSTGKGDNRPPLQTHWECGVGHLIKGEKPSSTETIWGGRTIEILYDEDTDDPKPEGQSSPFNACLSFLLRGHEHGQVEDAIRETTESWGGNVIVLSILDTDTPIEKPKEVRRGDLPEKYQDITLSDLRAALNVVCLGQTFYDHFNLSPYLILEAPLWVKAVQIHCQDDEELHKSIKYQSVWYQLLELEDSGTPEELKKYRSEIAEHIGMPLVIVSSLSKSDWASVTNVHIPARWSNGEALDLLVGANPKPKYQRKWNKPRVNRSLILRPLKCHFRLGTVTVYRRDLKEITTYQVEALTSYCSNVLRVAMKECGNEHEEKARQEVVDKYMNATKFLEYFDQLKAEKIASGGTSWIDASPPFFADVKPAAPEANEFPQSHGKSSRENLDTQAAHETPKEPGLVQPLVQPTRESQRLLAMRNPKNP